jgi:NAD(P)-dependent dehydrogenase (short-subunit alcohol dehydrogenase family)
MLKGRVAIITGGGKGIGAATARLFADSGAKVVIVSRTRSELESVAASIESRHGKGACLLETMDVSDESAVRRLFERTERELGAPSILINNAAIFTRAEIEAHTAEDWDRVMAVNVRGPFLLSREAFRSFKKAGQGGSIVNLSSLAGIRGTEKFPGLASYVTSKHAMVGLTEALAVEGRPHGIRANCVAPGAVDTEMLRQAAPHLKTQTRPEDVARILLHLSDPEQSGALNGSVIEIFSNL